MLIPRHTRVTKAVQTHLPSKCDRVTSILSRIGDKWSVLIVMLLANGPVRFNQLKRLIGGISQRMLALTLRSLERDGLVTRTVYPSIPPRVDYALTKLGHSLREPIDALGAWAIGHLDVIEQSRREFDDKAARALTKNATSPSEPSRARRLG